MEGINPITPTQAFSSEGFMPKMPQEWADAGMSEERFQTWRAHSIEGIESGKTAAWLADVRRQAAAGKIRPLSRDELHVLFEDVLTVED